MPFGTLLEFQASAADSIVNPMPTSNGVVVAVGDLIFALLAEQTDLTATSVSDNLGNTYSALNAGTDAGAITGRAFYARVTTAGTLTGVNIACTASANNAVMLTAVFQGPFRPSPLDASPANGSADVTSPYACPATGTLAQANELVINWAARNDGTTFAAQSPMSLAGTSASQTVAAAAIGYQVVTATTTVTNSFTAGSDPTQIVLGTASFVMDQSGKSSQATTNDNASRGPDYPVSLRTWLQGTTALRSPSVTLVARAPTFAPRIEPYRIQQTWLKTYNWSLIGKDQLPIRQRDWPLPIGRPYPVDLRTWVESYNWLLIGKDQLPVRQRDWPNPRGYEYAVTLRTFVGPKTVQVVTPMPFIQTAWPIPIARDYPVDLRTWAETYNWLLIGKDQLPVRQEDWPVPQAIQVTANLRTWIDFARQPAPSSPPDSPPDVIVTRAPIYQPMRGYEYPVHLRTWIDFLRFEIAVSTPASQQALTALPPQPSYPVGFRTWTNSYNPNLIGKDALPVGKILDRLPPYGPPPPVKSWTFGFPLELIGQDARLAGKQYTDRPPVPPWYRHFDQNLLASTLAPTPPAPPKVQTSQALPPVGPQQPDRFIGTGFNLNLIGKDQLPIRQQDWPNPRGFEYAAQLRTWIDEVRINLFGLVQRPFVQTDWPNPTGQIYPNTLRTWLDQTKLALIPPAQKPIAQTDWPVPRGPQQPDRTFIASVNTKLIGQDKLPVRQQDWPLPRGHIHPNSLRTFSATYNKNLVGKDQLPFRQMDWPVPKGPLQPDRTFYFDPLPLPILFPGPTPPPTDQRHAHSHRKPQYSPRRPTQPDWHRHN